MIIDMSRATELIGKFNNLFIEEDVNGNRFLVGFGQEIRVLTELQNIEFKKPVAPHEVKP